ncbi:hypothetical protein [Methylobacterium sp. CM6257]|jgi:hypothetical protein
MTIRTIVLAALAALPMIGTAMADERINVFPPIYRAQAHATAAVHPASELVTTPRLVPAAERPQDVAKVAEPEVTGSLAR